MAYFNNRRPVTEHVYADTIIWQCSACNCWSRMEFVSVAEPTCPICNEKMYKATKNIVVQ
jgi:rubrerythrin